MLFSITHPAELTNERRALGRKLRTNEKNFLGMLKESGSFTSEYLNYEVFNVTSQVTVSAKVSLKYSFSLNLTTVLRVENGCMLWYANHICKRAVIDWAF